MEEKSLNSQFQWECQPKAERFLLTLLDQALAANSALAHLKEELLRETSTNLFDWIDHIATHVSLDHLSALGFQEESGSYFHLGAQLPFLVGGFPEIAVTVESIADFLMVRGLSREIEGDPLSSFRRALISEEGGWRFSVVERRAGRSIAPSTPKESYQNEYLRALEAWKSRPREGTDEEKEIAFAMRLAKELVSELGEPLAATVVLEAERAFWQAKNRAGAIQKARQDHLGMGWANHDHHTFRSARGHFKETIELFEALGFRCRERFYAGEEAGWGAQVMEHPGVRLVLFLDVDLSPDEVLIDFAHTELKERNRLGTIGLWCALHGDSITKSGMHHLEAQFAFDELKESLGELGVGMMAPFSDFPFLKQAFTKGEIWPVSKKRIDTLLKKGQISMEEATRFLEKGALGSHMENLQRKEGYKGFNKKNVSKIILKTDPRSYL